MKEFSELNELFSKFGVDVVYVKHLAKKQDNEKNQIYLGTQGTGAGITNLLPGKVVARSLSESTEKRYSWKDLPKLNR